MNLDNLKIGATEIIAAQPHPILDAFKENLEGVQTMVGKTSNFFKWFTRPDISKALQKNPSLHDAYAKLTEAYEHLSKASKLMNTAHQTMLMGMPAQAEKTDKANIGGVFATEKDALAKLEKDYPKFYESNRLESRGCSFSEYTDGKEYLSFSSGLGMQPPTFAKGKNIGRRGKSYRGDDGEDYYSNSYYMLDYRKK